MNESIEAFICSDHQGAKNHWLGQTRHIGDFHLPQILLQACQTLSRLHIWVVVAPIWVVEYTSQPKKEDDELIRA